MNYRAATTAGSLYWPETRVRRRGLWGHKNLRQLRLLKSVAIYLAIFFLFLLGTVWTRVQVIETGYRLRQLEGKQERLKEENRSLLIEAATLKSPQRLEQVARELGLKRPTETQVYFLKNE